MQKRLGWRSPIHLLQGSNRSHTVFLFDLSYQLCAHLCSTLVQYSPSTSSIPSGQALGSRAFTDPPLALAALGFAGATLPSAPGRIDRRPWVAATGRAAAAVLSAGDAELLGCAAAALELRRAPPAACAKKTHKNPAIKRDPRMVLLPPP